jgi:hypothetical protein
VIKEICCPYLLSMLALRESRHMTMSVMVIYQIEVGAFFAALLLLLGHRMAVGKISLRGMFSDPGGVGKMHPERLLLFMTTVVLVVVFSVRLLLGGLNEMPSLSTGWLMMFGASCLVYAGMKAFRTFSRKT